MGHVQRAAMSHIDPLAHERDTLHLSSSWSSSNFLKINFLKDGSTCLFSELGNVKNPKHGRRTTLNKQKHCVFTAKNFTKAWWKWCIPIFSGKRKKHEACFEKKKKNNNHQHAPYLVINFWWMPQVGTLELSTYSKMITVIKKAESEAKNVLQPR